MCAGSNYKTLALRPVIILRVKIFLDNLGTIEEVTIRTIVISYVPPTLGELFTLILHEALIFESTLKSSLVILNQMRAHDGTVSDVPRKFDKTSTHFLL